MPRWEGKGPSSTSQHDPYFSPLEMGQSFEGPGTLINSGTMDSGVSGVGLDDNYPLNNNNHNNNRNHHPPQHISLRLERRVGEEGFGFSVIWSCPPQIGRVAERAAAERGGLRRGDLMTRVNGHDVSNLPKDTITSYMTASGNRLVLEVLREFVDEIDDVEGNKERSRSTPVPLSSIKCVHPVSILKPSAPPSAIQQPPPIPPDRTTRAGGGTAWKIRFNLEYLEKEEQVVREFVITELKFFRRVVAALDRYLIPAQANCLLSNLETHGIFGHLIKIITITKRILECVSHGGGPLGQVLLRTHSDHMSELLDGYRSYAKHLGSSASILADKMTFQLFARFVLETTVPKGHLDMTSLLFAPLEHLRNLCEIAEEILHSSPEWSPIAQELKDCYADIVCDTDYMEPISHVSMKKQPLLSVRHLEKRIVSTRFEEFKVCEKGRRWLFGSRLFRKETDGSFSAVWAFLFTDILVLTSHHTTRDRVFFVRDTPLKLQDVTTLHFNVPKKHENEFRLLFGPEVTQAHSRLDRLLLKKPKKPNQLILRTPNSELKNIWKLLLQRQIITLNTRISKSSSSNFSISEFCEKFPEAAPFDDDKDDESPGKEDEPPPPEDDPPPGVMDSQICVTDSKIPENDSAPCSTEAALGEKEPPSELAEISKPSHEEFDLNLTSTAEGVVPMPKEKSSPVREVIPPEPKIEKCESCAEEVPGGRRMKKVAHKDSPLIGGGGEGRRRRILVDYKVRGDYPELFGISPRDRRSFIKSLGQKVKENCGEETSLVTPYYYISPHPSPLPVQKQKELSKNVSISKGFGNNFIHRESLHLTPLNLVVEERAGERSPEESSSNDSGISDEPVRVRWSTGTNSSMSGSGAHTAEVGSRKSEVTTTSALPRVLETKQPDTQGQVARSVGVGTADKSTETDDPAQTLTPIQIRLLNNQRRRAFFSQCQNTIIPEKDSAAAEALIVKIFTSEALHHSAPLKNEIQNRNDGPWKRTSGVEYTLLEEEKTARLERVESSDDSTSSDAASASPASNENGTTDPSWSSSSSCKEDSMQSTASTWKPSTANSGVPPKLRPQILITMESTSSGGDGPDPDGQLTRQHGTSHYAGGDDAEEYFEDEDELSHSSHATMGRYGTYESLEKLENEDTLTGLPDFCRSMPRSRARFAFDEDDEEAEGDCTLEEDDLFEEDFESDFNFRFPTQVPDNNYSVSRLGPLPPLLEEDYEDEMYEEWKVSSGKSSSQAGTSSTASGQSQGQPSPITPRRQDAGLVGENRFLLSRIATIYARSSISPLKIFRDLWLKKRYREWSGFKE